MNFSYEAIRRIAGALRSAKAYPAKDAQIAALDSALGGDWWRELALQESADWVQQVLVGFADRVGAATRCSYITADVADSLTAKPVYELILFTRHDDGVWKMAESMSLARRDWRQWLVTQGESQGITQQELPGLDFADNEDEWVREIAKNVEFILAEVGRFRIEEKLGRVFGRTLGLARETHIRKALRALKADGVISIVPTGGLQRAWVDPI